MKGKIGVNFLRDVEIITICNTEINVSRLLLEVTLWLATASAPWEHFTMFLCHQGQYSPTILENVLCLIIQIFLYLATFECNTTFGWLNHTVYGSANQQFCYIQFHKILEKKTKNVVENGWWVRTQNSGMNSVFEGYMQPGTDISWYIVRIIDMWSKSSVVECRNGISGAMGSNPGQARYFFFPANYIWQDKLSSSNIR